MRILDEKDSYVDEITNFASFLEEKGVDKRQIVLTLKLIKKYFLKKRLNLFLTKAY
jgi:hypothetical protein